MSIPRPLRIVAATAAAVAVAFGAVAIGHSGSDGGGTAGTPAAQAGTPTGAPAQNGQMPPGFGTEATGTSATKAKEAALAKYSGTVERVMKLADGSYVVHVVTSSGEQHVSVSKDFVVTGTQQGGPAGKGAPSGTPPQGATPPSGSSGSSAAGSSS